MTALPFTAAVGLMVAIAEALRAANGTMQQEAVGHVLGVIPPGERNNQAYGAQIGRICRAAAAVARYAGAPIDDVLEARILLADGKPASGAFNRSRIMTVKREGDT